MIMREGMTVVLFGAVIGIVLAAAGTGVIRHLLYGSSSGDLRIYAPAALLLAGIGLLACWIPARRAASLDPLAALREE
jgi:ABC-type antimicrobial peptide transport system permease subunit